MDMNPTQTQSKTKTKVIVGLIIAGVIGLAFMVVKFVAYTPQGTVPIANYNTNSGELGIPVVDTAKEILAGPDRDTSLDGLNNNTNNSNTNSNGNANGNTNTTNANTGPDEVTKNQ